MKISYDAEVDALSITFREITVTTKHLAEGIAADYDSEGRLTGLEILDAQKRFGGKETMRRVELEGVGAGMKILNRANYARSPAPVARVEKGDGRMGVDETIQAGRGKASGASRGTRRPCDSCSVPVLIASKRETRLQEVRPRQPRARAKGIGSREPRQKTIQGVKGQTCWVADKILLFGRQ
jgi:uncharacterized protein YuzE